MSLRTVQLTLHYDGAAFSGWQRQAAARTVQGAIEEALARLCGEPVKCIGAGRTDAGVHARGQAAGVKVPARWHPRELRRALNAILPSDVWVSAAAAMHDDFHPRYSAISRRYSYQVSLAGGGSPFVNRYALDWGKPLDLDLLGSAAAIIAGEHRFAAFAVRGTAPATDSLRCRVTSAAWSRVRGGLVFEIEANRFLHHMVRFLVGTMLDVATGRRPIDDILQLLDADDNDEVSPPAPPHALFLDAVRYPAQLYL